MATRGRAEEPAEAFAGSGRVRPKAADARQLRFVNRYGRLRGLGEPRHLVGARSEPQQRDPRHAPQRAGQLGRRGGRPRHPISGACLDHPLPAARGLGLAPRLSHHARTQADAAARLALLGHPAGRGFGRPAPAEKLAATEWARRHFRRFLHGRRACHRAVPARCRRVVRRRPRLLRHRHHDAAVRLRHQHLAADRAMGATQRRCRRMGQCLDRRGHALRHACRRQDQAPVRPRARRAR